MCKCKSAILSGFSLNHAQLWDIDAAPWGPKLWAPSATLLGFSLIGAPTDVGSARHAPTLPVEQRASTGQKAISSVTRKRKLLEPVPTISAGAGYCLPCLSTELPALRATNCAPGPCQATITSCTVWRVLYWEAGIGLRPSTSTVCFASLGCRSRALGGPPGRWRSVALFCDSRLTLHSRLLQEPLGYPLYTAPVLYKMLLKLLRTLQVQASSPLVPTLRDNARQLLRSPRLTATDIRPVQQLYKRILLENEDAAARKYLLDKKTKLPWAGPAMSWLPSVLLCPSSLTLAVSRAYALRWITGEEADARFVYRIHFSRPEVCAHCNQNMPKDQLYRFGCAFQGSYCPGCLAQLRVPLERLWSVHWCPELDGHLLRPTEAWVDIPMVAAAPPVRPCPPPPLPTLSTLVSSVGLRRIRLPLAAELPCLVSCCPTAGGPGGFAVDGWQLQNCCHVH